MGSRPGALKFLRRCGKSGQLILSRQLFPSRQLVRTKGGLDIEGIDLIDILVLVVSLCLFLFLFLFLFEIPSRVWEERSADSLASAVSLAPAG